MNIVKQLLRQPLRLTAVILLLVLALSFFSLGVGVYVSSNATIKEIEKSFVTIGIPSNEMDTLKTELLNGHTTYSYQSIITPEIWEYLNELTEDDAIMEGIRQQHFVSAYSPEIATVLSASENGTYHSNLDNPYHTAMFVVSITSVGKPFHSSTGNVSVEVEGTVVQTVMLHPNYTPRKNIYISVYCSSIEEFQAMELMVGGQYLVYGTNYSDLDLGVRTEYANKFRCPLEEIDLSDISYDISWVTGVAADDAVAVYEHNGISLIMNQTSLNNLLKEVNACSLTAGKVAFTDFYPYQLDGTKSEMTISQLRCDAVMTLLETDLETFLTSDRGSPWQQALRQMEVQYQSVAVLGTELLESMYRFHQKEAFITQGRSFRMSEYDSGTAVCLISESTAMASSLAVGDTLDLSFYWGPNPRANGTAYFGAIAQEYSEKVGMTGEGGSYEIVGIYRQSDPWERSPYNFSPNTVFVPAASLPEVTYTERNGLYLTFVLKNGAIEAYEEAMTEKGYPTNILLCFDGGYTEISDMVEGFANSALQLFVAACTMCAAALLIYLVLFVFKQRRNVGLMLSLGFGERYTVTRIFGLTMLPVLVSSLVGATIGAALMNSVLQRMLDSAVELLDTTFSGSFTAGHASLDNMVLSLPYMTFAAMLASLLVFAAVVYLCLKWMTKKPPLSLIREG